MSEMVKRVAAAMEARSAVDPVDIEDIARAAIEAMREPTEAMKMAVYMAGDDSLEPVEAWVVMIDAAANPFQT